MGDSGFCRQRLIRWCERHAVGYLIGVARNARLHKAVQAWEDELKAAFARDGTKQRTIRNSATRRNPGTSGAASSPVWSMARREPIRASS